MDPRELDILRALALVKHHNVIQGQIGAYDRELSDSAQWRDRQKDYVGERDRTAARASQLGLQVSRQNALRGDAALESELQKKDEAQRLAALSAIGSDRESLMGLYRPAPDAAARLRALASFLPSSLLQKTQQADLEAQRMSGDLAKSFGEM